MSIRWKILITVLWLAFAGWLLRYELVPEWFTRSLSGYKSLLSDGALVVDNWMKIEFNGQQVGFSHSRVNTIDDDPDEQYRVANTTVLQLTILNRSQRVFVESIAILDPLYKLKRIEFDIASADYEMTIKANKIGPERFQVDVESKSGKRSLQVTIPDDTIIYSPMLELTLKDMSPGDEMNMKIYEPISMQAQTVRVRALRKETIEHRGKLLETTVLESSLQGMKAFTWIDENGKTIRQETPMGWTMEETSPEVASSFDQSGEASSDILDAMAVPLTGRLQLPRQAEFFRFRFENLSIPVEQMVSHRQKLLEQTEKGPVFLIHKSSALGKGDPEDLGDPEPFLESTPFVQSDDERIHGKALDIVGELEHPADRARAIFQWVYSSVRKNPSISLPSALDVLETLEGDCNEHTYLFVALARSLGIPSKIQIGIVYNLGAFYYHAWPAVYDGTSWIEMDPTLGQEQADATHIAFLNGEISNQLQLLSVIGRLKIYMHDEEITAHD